MKDKNPSNSNSSISSSSSSIIPSEPIGQNLIKLISNVCFSVFVFSVLIFTVIAITYQPPDPWLESAPALTNLFTQTENATFRTDTSIIKTGEDLSLSPLPQPSAATAASPAVTEALIQATEERIANSTPSTAASGCDDLAGTLNCSDPRVLLIVQRFNLRTFKSIAFFDYQPPMNGSAHNSELPLRKG